MNPIEIWRSHRARQREAKAEREAVNNDEQITSNDQRSNVMNPNNPAPQAARDNRSNQMNPNNQAYRSSRRG